MFRDIKLENVLFTEAKDVKLIDFGFSTINPAGKRIKIFCGTPSYMAPEIVQRTEYEGPPVDIWAAGVLLFACLCGQFPFRAQSYPDLYRRIARGTFAMPDELTVPVKELLRSMLSVDAGARPTAGSILRHPWLQAQLVAAPDMTRMRLDTAILISVNPNDDIDNQAVSEIVRFGISREEVVRLIMTRTHSSVATLYYLFLDALVSARVQSAGSLPLATSKLALQQGTPITSGLFGNKKLDGNVSAAGSSKREELTSNHGTSSPNSVLATQFLLKSAGGAGVLNLRPRSASATRTSSQNARPMSANLNFRR